MWEQPLKLYRSERGAVSSRANYIDLDDDDGDDTDDDDYTS